MNNYRVQLSTENAYEHIEFAQSHDYCFEIIDFALPKTLNSEIESKNALEFYKKLFIDYNMPLTMHGPFIDITISSPDKNIKNASIKRIINTLHIAQKLRAEAVVFHTNFNPLIRDQWYENNWIQENAYFWNEVLNTFGIKIYLENMWDTSPFVLNKLIQEVGNPKLKVCFDIGHFNVYSHSSIDEWMNILEGSIEYIHINDNQGVIDEHLTVGDGKIDWNMFAYLTGKLKSKPDIVFEVKNLEAIKKSMRYLDKIDFQTTLDKGMPLKEY